MRLALGPVLYYWARDDLLAFYEAAAQWPVDIVYLGETVCSKRRSFGFEDWLRVADQLTAAGKEVVLSTLALLEAESELKTLRRLCANGQYMVEANDLGAVHLLSGKAPFVTGPTVNLYNPATLRLLAERGLKRWTLPIELSRDTLEQMQAERPAGVETEVFAYGRLPLTLSARCFTARSHNLAKDDCQYRCLDDPDGRLMRTQEGQPFLVINGIQTMSAPTCNLIGEIDTMRRLGVDVVRISPQSYRTGEVIAIYHAALHGQMEAAEAREALQPLMPLGACDGYWHGTAGMHRVAIG